MEKGHYGKVKGYAIIDTEKFLGLLDKFIDRSERWVKDAEDREDTNDIFYYHGQKKAFEELKGMVENFK